MKRKIVLLAFGEMGESAFECLVKHPGFRLAGIVTPPRGAAIYRENDYLPVEIKAEKMRIPAVCSDNLDEVFSFIEELRPDAVVIATFNKIVPKKFIEKYRIINVHHGTLPRYRGRANINWAMINGLSEIGLTIHEVAPELDAGKIYLQEIIPIGPQDTIRDVYERLNRRLGEVLPATVDAVLAGNLPGKEQDPSGATYCCTRLPEDGLIDWNRTTLQIFNQVRALTKPYPGAFSFLDNEMVWIWSAKIREHPPVYEGRIPGRVTRICKGEGVEVLTGDGVLLVQEIETAGFAGNAGDYIRSVKKTFGINFSGLFSRVKILEQMLAELRSELKQLRER